VRKGDGAGAIANLIEHLGKLPGVGRKSAERMAHHLLNSSLEDAHALADAIRHVREAVRKCDTCGGFSEGTRCAICADTKRDRGTLCVVEMPRDVSQVEKTGEYRGLYHVLMGRLSPLEKIGPKDIRIRQLIGRIDAGGVREVILATNPTVDGDATAAYLQKALRGKAVKVTRPARGLPAGSALEYVDAGILGEALRARRESAEDR
jgi:recombination protein RecR